MPIRIDAIFDIERQINGLTGTTQLGLIDKQNNFCQAGEFYRSLCNR